MKKSILLKFTLFLGISFLFVQCLKKDEVHLTAEETAILKIKEAKEYFEIQFLPNIDNTKTEMNKSEGKSKRHTLGKNLDWDKADTKLLENGELGVYVPVLYDKDNYYIKGKWAWHSLSGLSYVLIYEKEKGKKSLEVVTTFPDAEYLSSDEKPEVFSGVVYVEDWNGKFIKSIRHFDGKMFLLDNLNNTKSSLYMLCSTVIDWYTCTVFGCNYNYSEIVYYVCDDSSGGDPYISTDYDPAPTGGGVSPSTDTAEDCNCDICPVCGGCLETSYKRVPADDGTSDPTDNVPDCPACTCENSTDCPPNQVLNNLGECVDPCDTSLEDLKNVFPDTDEETLIHVKDLINIYGKDFGIDTKEKMQHFFAQAGHESTSWDGKEFEALEENLNYQVELLGTQYWERYFNPVSNPTLDPNKENPNEYRRLDKPDFVDVEKFANYVYNRKDLGNLNDNDGYKYRGRGVLQLTGKNNYSMFNDFYQNNFDSTVDLISNPELISSDMKLAVISGLWFFQERVLNKIDIDKNTSIRKITKIINGGENGLEHREDILNSTKEIIECV